jgi:SPP1 gp7 family putative phage head morphogenesis protein
MMARELKENMITGEFQAVRLIRTEATFVANQAKLIALENSGVDEFEYVAVLDARTSEICQEHDGAIVTAKQAVFGLTLPPLHPNCRSTFVAKIPDEMKANLSRMALNPVTGEKEQIPRTMTYKEWKKSLYEQYGRAETDIAVKKIKNSRSDLAKFEMYGKTVRNLPESFEKFQDLKYNEVDKWKQFQREFRTVNRLRDPSKYTPEFRQKLVDTYYQFRDGGMELVDHAVKRFVGQKTGKGKSPMTMETLFSIWAKKPNFYEIENGVSKSIRFYKNIAIISEDPTNEVVTFVSRNKAKGEWRPK